MESDGVVRFVYICSAPVSTLDEIPEGMVGRELAEQQYARFTHNGPVSKLPQTLKYIWGSWLPKNPYEYQEKSDFKLYPPACDYSEQEPTVIHLHIPVRQNSH